jgi:uncharacterized protein (UPF0276 family)
MNLNQDQSISIGVNLRLEHIDDFIKKEPPVKYVEVIGDNWLSPGPHHRKLESVRENYGLYFHFLGMNIGGTDPIDQSYLKKIGDLINKFDPVHISDHLALEMVSGNYVHDLLPIPYNEKSLDNCVKKIFDTKEFLNLDRPYLIENLSYYVDYHSSDLCEAEFLNFLAKETDSKILLDLNNVNVNEKNLNIKSEDYLKKIDSQLVGEIHIAGAEQFDGILVDTHGSYPTDQTIDQLASHYFQYSLDTPVIYERDNNVQDFDDYISDVNKINQKVKEGLHG